MGSSTANNIAPNYNNTIVNNSNYVPLWFRCVVETAIAYFDIRSIISGLGSMEISSVWAAVKSAAKKYLGWIGAALLIYDIGTTCF